MTKAKILIVDDEPDIVELVKYNCERDGYRVLSASSGDDALKILSRELPDIILLDIMLPGMDGLETCRLIKQDKRTAGIPLIMLTAKSEESDVVVGLQLGADDYVTKPFSPKVLNARIKAVLRRGEKEKAPSDLRILGKLTIDLPKHQVIWDGRAVDLTTIEFNILKFLASAPGRVFNREQILDHAWQEGKFIVDRAVDVHILALRRKLKGASHWIETVRGAGYRFKEPSE